MYDPKLSMSDKPTKSLNDPSASEAMREHALMKAEVSLVYANLAF